MYMLQVRILHSLVGVLWHTKFVRKDRMNDEYEVPVVPPG